MTTPLPGSAETLAESAAELPLPLLTRGKVREVYAVGDDAVLMVASDRLSAYDVVLPTAIPDKGAVLTATTLWWFDQLADLVPNHLITASVDDYPAELRPYGAQLRGRSMLCRRLEMLPVECVARGYLTGSALAEYAQSGTVHGFPLPPGLRDGDRLPQPVFTPTSKAHSGHDEPISTQQVVELVGAGRAAELERLTLEILQRGSKIAERRGILIADTKVEFGVSHDNPDTVVLGDEVLTPDSSRFWPAARWAPGGPQPSFDKQYIRDWLTGIGFDRRPPGPELPPEVVERTRATYVEAYERLTGRSFADYLAAA